MKPVRRISYGVSKTSFPELFQNDRGQLYTIRIDSKLLEKIESEDPEATRDEAARELREIVNTVGKPSRTPPDRPVNHAYALPERAGYEIRFPNVEGYVYALCKPSIKVDFSQLERMVIEPEQTPTATFLRIITDHLEGGVRGGGIGEYVEHNRSEYYARHHLQEIEFEITRKIVADLVGEGSQAPVKGTARTRGLARHQLFPQVFKVVRKYVGQKVDFRGVHQCELGLEKYVKRIKERLLDAIVPDEQEGEMPLLPLLNRYKPIGTTGDVDFITKQNVHSTQRSHVNAVVLDSSWEQTAAFYLEQQTDNVLYYVRNDRPFLLIPYEFEGIQHHFEPDYTIRLKNRKTLILEIKGEENDQDRAKYQAARRWVTAINNWGRLGVWDFAVCRDPALLPKEITHISVLS